MEIILDGDQKFFEVLSSLKIRIKNPDNGYVIALALCLLDISLGSLVRGKKVMIQVKEAKDGPTNFLFHEDENMTWIDLFLNQEVENWRIDNCPHCRGPKRFFFRIYAPMHKALVAIVKFFKLDNRVTIINHQCEKCLNTGRIITIYYP